MDEKRHGQDDAGSSSMGGDRFTTLAGHILSRLEIYRGKNVNKYYREKELEYSEYTKMERYKNRVRVVDCFMDPLKNFLRDSGIPLPSGTQHDDPDIP